MKHLSISIIIILILACQSQSQNNTNSKLTANNLQKKNKLQTIPVMAENNTIVGGAFLLPEGWQGTANISYVTDAALSPFPYINMHNTTAELKGVCFGSFVDSPQHRRLIQQMNEMSAELGMESSLNKTYVKPIEPIEEFTQHYIFPHLKPEYKPTQLTKVSDFFVKNTQNQVLLTTLKNTVNPEKSAYLITIYYITQYNNIVNWKPYALSIEGLSNNKKNLLDILRLVANSFQFNPIFSQYITTINQQIAQGNTAAFNAQQNSIKGMQDHFFNTLHSVQKIENETYTSTSEQFSDMQLDVTTYRIPGMQEEIKLPSSSTYYYTNNLGDYIGSNNPLFDPNSQLTSIYNWQQLQKKY